MEDYPCEKCGIAFSKTIYLHRHKKEEHNIYKKKFSKEMVRSVELNANQ